MRKKVVSYSQYAIYKECGYRWYLTYSKKLAPFISSIHTVFGTCIHETLQLWLKVMYSQSGKAADEMDLVSDFKVRFIEEYKRRLQENNGVHFSTKEEMQEFYKDGIAILEWLSKKRKAYFSLRNVNLVGIEVPILTQANKEIENVSFKGAIDFILYNKLTKTYSIYDIKTSTRGWSDNDKRDNKKINQVLLYKKVFSEINNIPEKDIDVTFFVVKRKIPQISEWTISRVQEFKPSDGPIKVNKAHKDFQSFLAECFELNGEYKEKVYTKNIGDACRFCPFNNSPHLCDKKN